MKDLTGIIDVGSNSIRLCIYEIADAKSLDFKMIFNAKRPVGLASYVEDGELSSAGIKAAAKAIRAFMTQAKLFSCRNVLVFATAAVRNCSNSKKVVASLQKQCDCKVQVLSGEEEAAFSCMGIAHEVNTRDGVFIDLGGASTEFTIVKDSKIKECWSIPQGALSSWNTYVRSVLPTQAELGEIASSYDELLFPYVSKIPTGVDFYITGGSARTAARVFARLQGLDKKPEWIDVNTIQEIFGWYERDACLMSHLMLSVNVGRIHTLLPGCQIISRIFECTGASSMRISKSGVREGFLIDYLQSRTQKGRKSA